MRKGGAAHLNCGSPAKVGDDVIAGEPACNFGRGPEQCIPGAFIRTNDVPRLAADPASGHLASVWQDFHSGAEQEGRSAGRYLGG